MTLSVLTKTIALTLYLGACSGRQASVGSSAPPSSSSTRATTFSSVTFERTPCFGTCPVYAITVAGDGSVVFNGTRNVDSTGRFIGRIDVGRVASLRRAFDDAQYFALDDKYGYGEANCREYGTDAARILTSITTPERTKRVDHDLGCSNVPTRLADLYRRFDEIVGTSRWIGRR